jgi:hypothetical protein
MIETVTEVKDSNENCVTENKNKHRGKQLQMYKLNGGKGRDFDQRRDTETTETFLQGIKYFLCKQEIENAVRMLNYMVNNLGGQVRRRGKENNSWKGWY